MGKKILLFIFVFFFISVISASTTTYTSTTDTTCNNGICTKTLYSGIRNVYEDNQWKRMEDARSLKGSGIECVVNSDGENLVECLDWNYTSIDLRLRQKSVGLSSKSIPIKIYSNDGSGDLKLKSETSESFSLFSNKKEITLTTFKYGDIVHFGETSTTIQLQDNEIDNLGDAYTLLSNPDTNYNNAGSGNNYALSLQRANQTSTNKTTRAYYKFNISEVPSLSNITEATFYTYISGHTEDTLIQNISLHHVYDWINNTGIGLLNETTLTWNNQPCGGFFNNDTNCNLTREDYYQTDFDRFKWIDFNITNFILSEFNEGNKNVSFILKFENETATGLRTGDYDFHGGSITGKEYYYPSYRPYINITYIYLDISISYPTDQLWLSFNESISLNFTLTNTSTTTCLFTTDDYATNTTITGCQNTTFNRSDGNYLLKIWVEDVPGATSEDSVNFTVDSTNPEINITLPTNGSIDLLTTQDINYTVSDTNLDSCWYSNDSMSINNSLGSDGSCSNITTVIWGIGQHNITIWANDSVNNVNSSTITFTIDNINPLVNNTQISTTGGSNTITFSFNSSDTNLDSCWYSVFNSSGGIDPSTIENTSISCNSAGNSETISNYGTYNLTIYANDTLGNIGSNTTSFTTQAASNPPSGGGGSSVIIEISELAQNYSILATNLKDKMDIVLAKGSKAPRERNFVLINTGIEEIEIELVCDAQETLDENQTELFEGLNKSINICDYVTFEQQIIEISPNEDSPTISKVYVDVPEEVEFGDKYPFNILALRDTGTSEQFSKLSVTTRFPIWALVLKESYIPFIQQDVDDTEKTTYPVVFSSLLIAFIFFVVPSVFLRKQLPVTGIFIGFGLFIASFGSSLYFL